MRIFKRMTALLMAVCLLMSFTTFSLALEADGFTYTVSEDGNAVTITGYTGSGTDLVIPETIEDKTVTAIGESAFANCYTLTSVQFPDTLEAIHNYAFEGCSGISSVTFPDSLVSIGVQAFFNCSKLLSISLSDNTYDIGYYAFHNTAWYVYSDKGPLYIGLVFYSYKGAIPNGSFTVRDFTKAVAPSAFSGQSNVTEIYLPVGLRQIGSKAFASCSALSSVRIPPSVREINSDLFYNSPFAIVHGVRGSDIYSYISQTETQFVQDDTLDYFDGDMDKNSKVDSTDCRLLMRALVGNSDTYDHERFLSCNIVYDGAVDTQDLREWMRQAIM